MTSSLELTHWLALRMKEKGWGVRELARRAGVSHPIISDALNGKGASFDTCKALAFLFRVPAEQVLRMAGLLPNKTAKVEIVERAEHLYGLLTLDNQRKALEYLEFLKQQEEKGEYRVIKTEMPETG